MNQDITDASEFTRTNLPQLSQLDTLLRCHICKDFLKTPVLTPCCHTFCSLCIREYLTKEPKCPLCLNEVRESSLRSEFLVNEIVESYTSSRKQLLETLKKTAPERSDTPQIDINLDSDDDDLQIVATNDKSVLSLPNNVSANKITKATKKRASPFSFKNDKHKTTENMAQCPVCQELFPLKVLERSHLDECLTLQSLGKPARKPRSLVETSSSKSLEPSLNRPKISEPCGKEISHVDRYIYSSPDEEHQRLPKTNFTSMNLTQIKQKLSSLGLPTNGSRQSMIGRYNHYEMLWNSNFCDALTPVSENELKRQLASWEASQKNSNISSPGGLTISSLMKRSNNSSSYQKLLMDFKTDKFDRKSWINLFGKEFKTLIREAKKNSSTTTKVERCANNE